jgi:hypothetical protein
MDEAEPDMEKIESRTTDILQEKGEPDDAGHVVPTINSHPPLCPFQVVKRANMQPKQFQNGLNIKTCSFVLNLKLTSNLPHAPFRL